MKVSGVQELEGEGRSQGLSEEKVGFGCGCGGGEGVRRIVEDVEECGGGCGVVCEGR